MPGVDKLIYLFLFYICLKYTEYLRCVKLFLLVIELTSSDKQICIFLHYQYYADATYFIFLFKNLWVIYMFSKYLDYSYFFLV